MIKLNYDESDLRQWVENQLNKLDDDTLKFFIGAYINHTPRQVLPQADILCDRGKFIDLVTGELFAANKRADEQNSEQFIYDESDVEYLFFVDIAYIDGVSKFGINKEYLG